MTNGCPNCGYDHAALVIHMNNEWWIECCACKHRTNVCDTFEEALSFWGYTTPNMREVERLRGEVLKYKAHSEFISKLPDCNDCAKTKECKIQPKPGEAVRINCAEHVKLPQIMGVYMRGFDAFFALQPSEWYIEYQIHEHPSLKIGAVGGDLSRCEVYYDRVHDAKVIQYNDVWPGVDLKYICKYSYCKEILTIRNREALEKILFMFGSELDVSITENGVMEVRTKTEWDTRVVERDDDEIDDPYDPGYEIERYQTGGGDLVFRFEKPQAIDANGQIGELNFDLESTSLYADDMVYFQMYRMSYGFKDSSWLDTAKFPITIE